MIPDPLHPAVVHFPIAFASLVPMLAVLGVFAIARGFLPARTWWAVVALQAMLAGSAFLAVETGEDEEERVERVLDERLIEEHEEAAERLLWLAGIGLVVAAVGLAPGRAGAVGRGLGAAASLVVLAASVPVGRLGGELVYKHGAASAYVEDASAPGGAAEHDDDEDDSH